MEQWAVAGPVNVQGGALRPPYQLNYARDGMPQTRLPEVAAGGHVSPLVAKCQNSGAVKIPCQNSGVKIPALMAVVATIDHEHSLYHTKIAQPRLS